MPFIAHAKSNYKCHFATKTTHSDPLKSVKLYKGGEFNCWIIPMYGSGGISKNRFLHHSPFLSSQIYESSFPGWRDDFSVDVQLHFTQRDTFPSAFIRCESSFKTCQSCQFTNFALITLSKTAVVHPMGEQWITASNMDIGMEPKVY